MPGRGSKDQMGVGHWGQDSGVGALGVAYQTRDGVPGRGWGYSQGWGSRLGMGFQTWNGVSDMGMGSRHGLGFQTWGGVPDREFGTRHRYQTDDGVPGRGGVIIFTSHQSGILHSLIFPSFLRSMKGKCRFTKNGGVFTLNKSGTIVSSFPPGAVRRNVTVECK